MRSFASNLAYVHACLAEWSDYEHAETLFWPLASRAPAGSPPFLQMTIGNLLLALDEMRAVEPRLDSNERFALRRVEQHWQSQWEGRSATLERKVLREVTSRLRQWQAYVNDVLESHDVADYRSHIRPRLCAVRLLEALGSGYEKAPALLAELEASDALLDPWLTEGPCLLGQDMVALYPLTPRYRFLYRQPRLSRGGA